MVRLYVITNNITLTERIRKALPEASSVRLTGVAQFDHEFSMTFDGIEADIVGIDATENTVQALDLASRIMRHRPMPVVLLAEHSHRSDVQSSADDHNNVALTVLELPCPADSECTVFARNLALLAEVKVIRRWEGDRFDVHTRIHGGIQHVTQSLAPRVVAIGASAGGTKALQEILSRLPGDFVPPILVVQHIASGYVNGFARWLDEQTALRVNVARNNEEVVSGNVYLAPDDVHLTVVEPGRIELTHDEAISGFRPAIARLFSSVLETYKQDAIVVLLSGMGVDGAAEMRALRDAGAMTIAQDKETSLIHGIPGEAIKMDAVRFVLPIQEIGPAMITMALSSMHKP